jgi:formylmethanofuran dehydrogenase subunit C
MTDELTIEITSPVSCLCDFTYNFFWQHKGSQLDPDTPIEAQISSEYTYRDLIEQLRSGGDIHIKGNTGSRLASSMGVDLTYFGGSGQAVKTGNIILDGDAGTRMGISMVSGRIYVKGAISQPMGNVVEIVSDRDGYRCFRSITDILHNGIIGDAFSHRNNSFIHGSVPCMVLADNVLRDTVGARCNRNVRILVKGDMGLSTGILMQKGIIDIKGDTGMNTATLLSGGIIVVRGNVGEFAATGIRAGKLIITGKNQGYLCPNMHGGAVFIKKDIKVIPPARKCRVLDEDIKMLMDVLTTGRLDAMSYRKYSIC